MNAPLRQMTKTVAHFLYHPTRTSGVTGVLQFREGILKCQPQQP